MIDLTGQHATADGADEGYFGAAAGAEQRRQLGRLKDRHGLVDDRRHGLLAQVVNGTRQPGGGGVAAPGGDNIRQALE